MAHSTITADIAGEWCSAVKTISPTSLASALVSLMATFTISHAACSFIVSASSTEKRTRDGFAAISARITARTGPLSTGPGAGSARAEHQHASETQTSRSDKRFILRFKIGCGILPVERAAGIEPAWPAWKAGTLPLSYARLYFTG